MSLEMSNGNVTKENLQALAWKAGYKGVPGLARALKRHRITVWRAVRWPDQFGPTYRAILAAVGGR